MHLHGSAFDAIFDVLNTYFCITFLDCINKLTFFFFFFFFLVFQCLCLFMFSFSFFFFMFMFKLHNDNNLFFQVFGYVCLMGVRAVICLSLF